MQFEIPVNSQFAAITIDPISVFQGLPELIDLGKGRYLVVRPAFEIEPFWQTQLGEIKSKRISENRLLLIVVVSSDRSDGSMDRDLSRSVRSVLYSLFLQIFTGDLFLRRRHVTVWRKDQPISLHKIGSGLGSVFSSS